MLLGTYHIGVFPPGVWFNSGLGIKGRAADLPFQKDSFCIDNCGVKWGYAVRRPGWGCRLFKLKLDLCPGLY